MNQFLKQTEVNRYCQRAHTRTLLNSSSHTHSQFENPAMLNWNPSCLFDSQIPDQDKSFLNLPILFWTLSQNTNGNISITRPYLERLSTKCLYQPTSQPQLQHQAYQLDTSQHQDFQAHTSQHQIQDQYNVNVSLPTFCSNNYNRSTTSTAQENPDTDC